MRTATSPGPQLLAFLDEVVARCGASRRVLELGSGTGRDALLLEARGLVVERTDATRAFVDMLRRGGHDARVLNALTDDLGGRYAAVLANAVFLHFDDRELRGVLARVRPALATDGVLAFTVKQGEGARWSTDKLAAPRHFTYWQPGPLCRLLEDEGWAAELLTRHTGGHEPWIFVIARPAPAEENP